MKTLIINDLHIGIKRSGGTTPKSRKELDEWMMGKFSDLLLIPHDRLIILGDLCDSRNIPEHLMKQIIRLLKNENAYLVLGNHCLGGIGDHTLSSTEFIADLLDAPAIYEPMQVDDSIYIVPHMFNQELHEEAIANCPDNVWLLTHCNIDSPFASGDHSLNLSQEEIKSLKGRGVRVLAAHEHARRDYMGNVFVIGNQMPSSIADCLHGDSFAAILEDGELTFVPTWQPEGDYLECDYSEIQLTDHKFIRVNGTCNIIDYPKVVKDIAELRKNSQAFIVSNNVKVKVSDSEVISAEEVTNFNIIELLLERIEPEFKGAIEKCI